MIRTPKKLLYITQVIPMPTGSGLAMRAYQVLKAHSSDYSVYLLILGKSLRQRVLPSELSICRNIQYVPADTLTDRNLFLRLLLYKFRPHGFVNFFSQPREWGFVSDQRIQTTSDAFSNLHFDVIHAFRLYSAPFAEPFFRRSDFQQLDLDDIDSLTRGSISRLYSENGEEKEAALNARESQLYAEIERITLPKWKRVFVCSETDKNKLNELYGHPDIQVLPNVIAIPDALHEKQAERLFRFLFVGSFHYYPNRDAIQYFCKQVLPLLRKTMNHPFVVSIVGGGLNAKFIREFNQIPEIKILGFVSDLQELYKNSDAALVPIRAGGGTRLKVLEAFSFQVPVISTSVGIGGINAQNEEHCLVGDTPEAFAEQCARIIQEKGLRSSLAQKAFDLVQNYYSPEMLARVKV